MGSVKMRRTLLPELWVWVWVEVIIEPECEFSGVPNVEEEEEGGEEGVGRDDGDDCFTQRWIVLLGLGGSKASPMVDRGHPAS